MNRVRDKVAIVTGGSRGIGRAISLLLAEEGAKICIIARDDKVGKKTATFIKGQGGEATFIKSDVTNVKRIESAVREVIKKYGKIDILVNNVGAAKGTLLDDVDENIFQMNVDVNFKSAVFCTKAVLPTMMKQHSGSVIFISSVNAIVGGFGLVIYSSVKGALFSLARTLTADYSKYNIRFNVVCPGTIPCSKAWQERERAKPGTLETLAKIYPLGRTGEAIDVAQAVLFLASDEASWITGTVLPVDGGITATGRLPGGEWWNNL